MGINSHSTELLHFDALYILDTEGVNIGLLSPIVRDPLGFVLYIRWANQYQNAYMEERVDLEQPHGPYAVLHVKAEAVVDPSREHQEIPCAHVAANPRLGGVLWEDHQRPADLGTEQKCLPRTSK